MQNLKTARQKGKIDEFVKEHEADPQGDLDKLDATIKNPTNGTEKAVRQASSLAASDD